MALTISPIIISPTPVVPTLSKNFLLQNPSDIIAYTIRQFCSAPKSFTETYRVLNISSAENISRYSGDITSICAASKNDLQACFSRIYGNGNASVDVTYDTANGIDYTMEISVTVIHNGRPYAISSDVQVNPVTGKIISF
jgi:hypothetical protein